ncbi:hypothetical protein SLEP1_g47241 [Rubroshorea leprosula]|uniref:Uncharacterized protein n=1 Tax=Rubroshorea leprosula TaxID=152421 RepID=A0AAV5LRQ3_9ROSI|nr:hypothetical protein SLEP1_g47241 [Rubroshorea leprosula]
MQAEGTDQEAEAEAAAILLSMQAAPAVNIRTFPILPEAREPDKLSSVARRAAVKESRRVPHNLISREGWGARRRRSAIAKWGRKKPRSGPVSAN